MKRRIARTFAAMLLAFLLIVPPPLSLACGPDFSAPIYTDFNVPDARDASYAAGKLGLLEPGYWHIYLFEAYRNLSGKPFSKSELAALGLQQSVESPKYETPRPASGESENWITTWDKTRANLLREKQPRPRRDFDSTGITRATMRDEQYTVYYNCLSGAFENAVHTLQNRVSQFGAQSPVVKEWIAAQDQVFENCSSGMGYPPKPTPAVIPAAAREDDPAVIRADRAYQIAAALFYAGNFDAAQKAFEDISTDSTSPYQKIALYLRARVLIRKGTVEAKDAYYDVSALSQAEAQLRDILADKDFREFHPAAQRLLGFVRIRIHRQERFRELETAVLDAGDSKSFGQDLTDYLWLLDRPVLNKTVTLPGASANQPAQKGETRDESTRLPSDDMTDWIFTFHEEGEAASQHSFQRWHETKSLPWLVASIAKASAKDSSAAELLAAAAKIGLDSSAYLTIAFHRLRLLEESGNLDRARRDLDQLLAEQGSTMPISARNQFRALRMKLAENLLQFLQFAPRISTDATGVAPLPAGKSDYDPGTPEYAVTRPHFDSDASVALSEKLPLRLLADAAKSADLPPSLRADIAVAAWTRAVQLKNGAIDREIIPVLGELIPELKNDLAEYSAAQGNSREFAAVFAILRNPGFRPFVNASPGRGWFSNTDETHFSSINNFGDNWWCSFVSTQKDPDNHTGFYRMFSKLRPPLQEIYPGGDVPEPGFISTEEKTMAADEIHALADLPSAPRWLGQITVSWARSHPDDPRVPEALHNVVRAWRYGCTETPQNDPSNYSKDAFEILHKSYPDSGWTKKTPYWFQ